MCQGRWHVGSTKGDRSANGDAVHLGWGAVMVRKWPRDGY